MHQMSVVQGARALLTGRWFALCANDHSSCRPPTPMRFSDPDALFLQSSLGDLPAGAVAVRIRLPGRVPLAVVERGPWPEPPLVLFCEDGTTEVRAATCDLEAAARWVLERGDEAEALAPPPLRRRVATQARRIYRCYRSDDARSEALFQWRCN
ncbi:MAG: hypothetical protein BRD44_00490 [Bacteroidetes bacterium QS_7_67_15]|nr:MAG: hypothetical protein BRD44_00490 [Bacteroidetes bacterium QS_7_67_15]